MGKSLARRPAAFSVAQNYVYRIPHFLDFVNANMKKSIDKRKKELYHNIYYL